MAEKDATWRLTVTRDQNAKSQAKAFADSVLAETERITNNPAKLNVESNLDKIAAESQAFYRKQTKDAKDYEDQQVRISEAAKAAIVKTSQEMKDKLGANAEQIKSVAVRLATDAAEEIKRLEKDKTDFIARQNALRARADRQMQASLRATDEAIRTVGDSMFRLGRGIVAVGLIGEKDLQKVTDGLLAIQGAYDLFAASSGIVRGLTKAWQQYQAAVKAATAAQLALNAAQAAGTLTGGGMLSGGLRGAGSFLAKTAAGRLAMIGGPIAAAAAGGKLAYDIAAGRGTINPNSLSGRALGSTTNLAGSLDLAMGNRGTAAAKAVESARKLAEFEARTLAVIEKRKELDEKINALIEDRKQQESRLLANLDQQLTLRLSGKSAIQQIKILNQEIADQESRRSRDTEASQRRIADLVQQRGEAEKKIANDRAAAAREAMEASRDELATAKERLMTERQTLDTARQRFGAMDRASQDEILAIVKKARSGGQLDSGELGKLSSLGTKEAERIVAQQSRNRVAGDYSEETQRVRAIEAQRDALLAERRRIEREAPDKYNSQGEVVGKLVGRQREEQYAQIDQRVQTLTALAAQIRIAAQSDAKLRESLFGGERAAIARSAQQASQIQAKVNHEINVVARFDNTAKQVAEQAVSQIVVAMRPFMNDVDRELQRLAKDVSGLVNTRRQLIPGRS